MLDLTGKQPTNQITCGNTVDLWQNYQLSFTKLNPKIVLRIHRQDSFFLLLYSLYVELTSLHLCASTSFFLLSENKFLSEF